MEKDTFNINSQIIGRCLEGDVKAQFMLYKNYSVAMYNIAIRITGNRMDAEDVLQESFVTVFERLGELQSLDSFSAWLKRIVLNNSISCIRKRKIVFEDLDAVSVNDDDEEFDMNVDPAVVHNAIKELPDGSRSVLVLHAMEGYKHREIADMLSISESTSKSQYKRALELLNANLKKKIYER
jgi:RNA polymerase sigma-70 factor (ECF subfamily)